MANLKEIRTRISSVSSTKKITSAMKMVSAAKFKKAQNNLIKFRPFNEKISFFVEDLGSSNSLKNLSYFTFRKEIKNVAILLITSNNSMCGAFNSTIIKAAIQAHSSIQERNPYANITFYCLGKKGEDVLRRAKYRVEQINPTYIDKPKMESTNEIFDYFFKLYNQGKLDRVELVYNRFKNAASQIQINETLLPILKQSKSKDNKILNKPIVEPEPKILLEKLLPYYLKNKLHSAILESSAAEHGARMTAMHQATENATTLLNNLVLDYNKARQAAITNEILEIVSGANALKE
ncbi:MAG TPA: ATP synthase F1 subunit gamma [Tenuifilaceae bacterium]|nr:ATP synthase F1 subunit gamma [Tenuifilaceae bacterium]HPN21545.1 ATP synthase F1 subunit gamma [Tenuifilaceae bacterium]HPV56706.1 ATP synthase F1 subunit gamma [Tenuifilaceae bacterium]